MAEGEAEAEATAEAETALTEAEAAVCFLFPATFPPPFAQSHTFTLL